MTLQRRILFTTVALVIYRLGLQIPIPGVDLAAIRSMYIYPRGAGLFAVFSLGIHPYLQASFIVLIFSVVLSPLKRLFRGGTASESNLDAYARLLAVGFAALRAYSFAVGLEGLRSPTGGLLVAEPGVFFRLTTVISLIAGTVVMMWLAEAITTRGIGNGILLILFAQYAAQTPFNVTNIFELARSGAMPINLLVAFIGLCVGTVWVVVFMERARRHVPIVFRPPNGIRRLGETGIEATLPLKLNLAGIVPPLFASQLLLIPFTIRSDNAMNDFDGFTNKLATLLTHGQLPYTASYVLLIIGIGFLYTFFVAANPREIARRLHLHSGTLLHVTPDTSVAAHLSSVIASTTLLGGLYLAAICALPEFLVSQYALPFYFGSSSLLVFVAIAIDTVDELRAAIDEHRHRRARR